MNGTTEQKLDSVLAILRGEEDRPGLMHQVNRHEAAIYGTEGDMGDHHRVAVMWRIHVWLLCSCSAALGGMLTLGARWVVVNFKI